MGQTFKIIRCLFIALIIISCNNKKEENSKTDLNLYKNKILSYNFPDTVKVNKVIEGKLQYDVNSIEIDSSITSKRFLVLLLSTSINKELADYNEVNNNRLLSYIDSLNTGKFEFKAVFEKKGKQMLNIAIRDYKYLKPKKNTPPDKIVIRTRDCVFSKEVYVVD